MCAVTTFINAYNHTAKCDAVPSEVGYAEFFLTLLRTVNNAAHVVRPLEHKRSAKIQASKEMEERSITFKDPLVFLTRQGLHFKRKPHAVRLTVAELAFTSIETFEIKRVLQEKYERVICRGLT
jgi:hypothetical protein